MSQFVRQPEHKELAKHGKKPHNSWLIFNLILPKPTTDDFQLSVQPIWKNGQRDILAWPSNSSLEPGQGGESSLINAGRLSNGNVRQVPQFIESIKRNIGWPLFLFLPYSPSLQPCSTAVLLAPLQPLFVSCALIGTGTGSERLRRDASDVQFIAGVVIGSPKSSRVHSGVQFGSRSLAKLVY